MKYFLSKPQFQNNKTTTQLFKSLEFGNGNRMAVGKLVIHGFKYLQGTY